MGKSGTHAVVDRGRRRPFPGSSPWWTSQQGERDYLEMMHMNVYTEQRWRGKKVDRASRLLNPQAGLGNAHHCHERLRGMTWRLDSISRLLFLFLIISRFYLTLRLR